MIKRLIYLQFFIFNYLTYKYIIVKKNNEKGIVYLLGDWEKEGFYKIGVTKDNLERRIKKLQTGNSGEIYVINYFETEHPFFLEKQLHFKYQGKRAIGEWFELTNEEVLNFEKSCGEIEEMVETMKDNPFFPKKLHE